MDENSPGKKMFVSFLVETAKTFFLPHLNVGGKVWFLRAAVKAAAAKVAAVKAAAAKAAAVNSNSF